MPHAPTRKRTSVGRAIWTGMVVVNGPVTVIVLGGLAAVMSLGTAFGLEGWLAVAVAFSPFVLAWVWWSVALPRWRVWALERVHDRDALISRAIDAGLMWPPGHAFEKTEIRPQRLRERERAVGWGVDPGGLDPERLGAPFRVRAGARRTRRAMPLSQPSERLTSPGRMVLVTVALAVVLGVLESWSWSEGVAVVLALLAFYAGAVLSATLRATVGTLLRRHPLDLLRPALTTVAAVAVVAVAFWWAEEGVEAVDRTRTLAASFSASVTGFGIGVFLAPPDRVL